MGWLIDYHRVGTDGITKQTVCDCVHYRMRLVDCSHVTAISQSRSVENIHGQLVEFNTTEDLYGSATSNLSLFDSMSSDKGCALAGHISRLC